MPRIPNDYLLRLPIGDALSLKKLHTCYFSNLKPHFFDGYKRSAKCLHLLDFANFSKIHISKQSNVWFHLNVQITLIIIPRSFRKHSVLWCFPCGDVEQHIISLVNFMHSSKSPLLLSMFWNFELKLAYGLSKLTKTEYFHCRVLLFHSVLHD